MDIRKKKRDREIVTRTVKVGEGKRMEFQKYVTCLSDEVFSLLYSQDTSALSIPRYVDRRPSCLLLRFSCVKARYSIFRVLPSFIFR